MLQSQNHFVHCRFNLRAQRSGLWPILFLHRAVDQINGRLLRVLNHADVVRKIIAGRFVRFPANQFPGCVDNFLLQLTKLAELPLLLLVLLLLLASLLLLVLRLSLAKDFFEFPDFSEKHVAHHPS